MLGNHPITPVLLATDLAAVRVFYHGKLGLQIDRKNENAIGSRYGNGIRLDVTQSPVGTADQQTQAAWQVSDIGAEVAELRARGIKVEDCDTPGPKTEDGIADIGFAWPPGSSTQPRTSSAQPDACHLTWPELRPGGLRGRRLRRCGSLLGSSLRSCQGHLL
jgi:catechol 2,3-dioxygenase-like lactoylglutathione lyase family enzyme